MIVGTLVGNPKPRSRTLQVARSVAVRLGGSEPDLEIDLTDLGADLLDWSSSAVAAAVDSVAACDLLVVASPTFKGTFSGLLKLFLDRIATDGLAGVTAVPVMLGADLRHNLAVDMALRPVLIEIGATCPTRGLFVIDSHFDDVSLLDAWAGPAGRQVAATVGHLR